MMSLSPVPQMMALSTASVMSEQLSWRTGSGTGLCGGKERMSAAGSQLHLVTGACAVAL